MLAHKNEAPADGALTLLQCGLQIPQFTRQRPDAFDLLSGIRQKPHGAAAPVEQGRANGLLDYTQPPRKCRLRHVPAIGCRLQRAEIGDSENVFEPFKAHAAPK